MNNLQTTNKFQQIFSMWEMKVGTFHHMDEYFLFNSCIHPSYPKNNSCLKSGVKTLPDLDLEAMDG